MHHLTQTRPEPGDSVIQTPGQKLTTAQALRALGAETDADSLEAEAAAYLAPHEFEVEL